jgi:hypothetical protein
VICRWDGRSLISLTSASTRSCKQARVYQITILPFAQSSLTKQWLFPGSLIAHAASNVVKIQLRSWSKVHKPWLIIIAIPELMQSYPLIATHHLIEMLNTRSHTPKRLMKRRSMDYEGLLLILQPSSMGRQPREAVFLLNLHPASTQDVTMLEGLLQRERSPLDAVKLSD